jgi:hypothetical protein
MLTEFSLTNAILVGLFYEVRRKYLKKEGEDNALAPPDDFINHISHRGMNSRTEVVNKTMYQQAMEDSKKTPEKFHLQFAKPRDDRETVLSKAQVRRQEASRRAKIPKKIITIERFSSTNPEDWMEDLQAGCHIWINRKTGEVTSSCPWIQSAEDVFRDTSEFTIKSQESDECLGTGSLVYNEKDIQDLFAYLDRVRPTAS